MSKPNIRSFRYSDYVAKIIMDFKGDNMSDKFENLVLYCHQQVPNQKKRLEYIEQQIKEKRSEYEQLCKDLQEVSSLIETLKQLKKYGDIAVKKAELISKNLHGQEQF